MSKTALIAAAAMFMATATAHADVIVSPVSATASSTTAGFPITNAINHSGLSSNFVSGVTNFDTYLAGNPLHSWLAENEWFSAEDTTTATLTFDLGAVDTITRMALWNEDSSGIGMFDAAVSSDGRTFTTVLAGASPIDNPEGTDYPAQVFALGGQTGRYVRISASGCPQPNPGDFNACGMGEIAFAVTQAVTPPPSSGVPAPGAFSILALGLAGIRRRR